MDSAAENAPLFIEAFFDACEDLKDLENPVPVPDLRTINAVLAKHDTHFRIDPPNLVHTAGMGPVTAPEIPETLEQKTQTLIKESFEEAKKLGYRYPSDLEKLEDLPEILHEIIDGRLQPSQELRDFAQITDMAWEFTMSLDQFSQKYPDLADFYELVSFHEVN
jgi:hypothetical protein